ncbi:hypothetical protein STEG23_000793, partial [Scotinomys teguina]
MFHMALNPLRLHLTIDSLMLCLNGGPQAPAENLTHVSIKFHFSSNFQIGESSHTCEGLDMARIIKIEIGAIERLVILLQPPSHGENPHVPEFSLSEAYRNIPPAMLIPCFLSPPPPLLRSNYDWRAAIRTEASSLFA